MEPLRQACRTYSAPKGIAASSLLVTKPKFTISLPLLGVMHSPWLQLKLYTSVHCYVT